MKTLPIEGTFSEVSFYEDDTVGRVRELIALDRNSHPDRLFLQLRVTLPEGYYRTPKEWTDLFFRLSRDGATVSEEALKTYLTQIRSGVSAFPARTYTREQWDAIDPESPIRDGGQEWHILGASVQTVLPLPPKDVSLPTNVIPLLSTERLMDVLHPFPSSELRVTQLPAEPSDAVLRAYFPLVREETPPTLDASKASIQKAQAHLGALLALPIKRHTKSMLTKAKWYIPLNATQISTPRITFEQLFYGLTVSKETPYIAYFTAEGNALRSKFYVDDPTTKTPVLDTSLLKAWYESTKPNRRRPTLLLYRGTSRTAFQRIAITSSDITVDIRKDKTSTKRLDDLKAEAEAWLLSLDAIVPSLDRRDLALDRWELSDLSLVATYAKEETDFDLLRFPCLQTIFGEQAGTFRLLRSDQGSVPRRVLEACQALTREGAVPTIEYLAGELGTSAEEATTLLDEITAGDINCDRALRDFPTVRFDRKEVEISFATNPERILLYADLLRYVLTTDSDAVNAVCPRRKEAVAPLAAVPQSGPPASEEEADEDLLALLGVQEEPAVPAPAPEPVTKGRMLKVAKDQQNTQNYFNTELQKFNAELFAPPYSKECEKSNQVVVLTPEQRETIRTTKGEEYTYEDAPDTEQLDIPGGTAICPPYWCMTDTIPLREDQLIRDGDGVLHCPVCDGKVRLNDKVSTKDFPVIKRETSKGKTTPYPKFMRKRDGVPCCYPTPAKDVVARNLRKDETYILNEDSRDVPAERAARLSPELAARLGVTTSYATSIVKGRLEFEASDVFRIGLGRPSASLPRLLSDYTTIPTPAERPALVKQCSFFSMSRSADPIDEMDRRYREGTLPALDELEYLSFVLNYSAVLVNMETLKVLCGFRTSEIVAKKKTLVFLLHSDRSPDVLGIMRRKRKGRGYDTEYALDIQKSPLAESTAGLLSAHDAACAGDLPTLQDAWAALQELRISTYDAILDPLERIQGVLVRGQVYLPVVPAPHATAATTRQLAEIPDAELPSYASQVSALESLKRQDLFGREPSKDRRNVQGQIVELETVTGFRIPVRPTEPSPGPTTEVLQTVRNATGVTATGTAVKGEQVLLSETQPDPEGRKLKDTIDYASELYEFLLMSLASDIAVDASGDSRDATYAPLRTAIQAGDIAALTSELAAWYAREAYEQKTKTPYQFLSKVRTPCGQLTSEKTCSKSSLCGWSKGDCKIQVRTSLVKSADLLERVRTTLVENPKQRALVLDNRISRFFSTVLYLELPHEWITTSY
jgi:hypothetical protein